MGASRHALLDEALAISRQMVGLGEQGDWDAVIALESQRRGLLESAFATREPADEIVADRVKAILDLDKGLMALSRAARDQISEELAKTSAGRKAATAYHAAGA